MAFCAGSVLRNNTKHTDRLCADDSFMAMREKVTIVPTFSKDEPIELMDQQFPGTFKAHIATKVPLWVALRMYKRRQCKIELPLFMHEEELKRARDEERESNSRLTKLPHYYLEIACILLVRAYGQLFADERERQRTSILLRELVECRRAKIVSGMKAFEVDGGELAVGNMAASELTCFRLRSLYALDKFLDLLRSKNVAIREDVDGSSQEVSSSQQGSTTVPAQDSGPGQDDGVVL